MPELPDVEIFKQYLDATSLHQKIESLRVEDESVLEDVSVATFSSHLEGSEFEESWRHGKYLFVRVDQEWMVLHFGMTGKLRYYKRGKEQPDFARVIFEFCNGYQLVFDCMRKLGFLTLVDDSKGYIELKELGPDALSIGREEFADLLDRSRGMVKSSLMNQSLMAGVGNVYSDEILYQARIHPKRRVDSLSDAERDEIYSQLKRVLSQAIESRVDPDRFPSGYLLPRRDEGKACPGCGGQIERIKVSGRSSYICADCQE